MPTQAPTTLGDLFDLADDFSTVKDYINAKPWPDAVKATVLASVDADLADVARQVGAVLAGRPSLIVGHGGKQYVADGQGGYKEDETVQAADVPLPGSAPPDQPPAPA